MSVLGNCFAIGLLLIISLVYFQNKYFLTKAAKYFAVCLIFSSISAAANICYHAVIYTACPGWVVGVLGFIDAVLPLFTTSLIGLYLVCKLIEHTYEDRHFYNAQLIFATIFLIYLTLVITNVWTGIIFSVGADGTVTNGPLFFANYAFITIQLFVVAYFCIIHRKSLSKNVRRALAQSVPAVLSCVLLKIFFTDTSFLVLGMTVLELVFFMNFQSQRVGVNTLTKLNDKRRFFLEVEDRIRLGDRFKAFLIRIENFGVINDTYGHKAGDEILYHFSFAIERLFGEGVAFHIHSTTFAIILPLGTEEENAKETERILTFAAKGLTYMSHDIKLDCTVAEHRQLNDTEASIFYEKLEYTAEKIGESKLNYALYTHEMGDEMFRKKYIISRLQHIDKEHGFEVWFQPIYSVRRGCFSSMETLLRLREGDGTLISPAEFIPLAEKTGLITPITWFVIEEVCHALSENSWLDGMRASINLPMIHLLDPEFETKLNGIVDSYGIPHERLSFEFTERVILEDLDTATENMRRLVAGGYTFYLDDFGVGYSNFNCVLRLPLNTVKLDMSLTSTTDTLRENYGLVYILTDLFHDMGFNVVAEGAETEEQVEILRTYGVDRIQGYYFAKPMSLSKLQGFLQEKANNSLHNL